MRNKLDTTGLAESTRTELQQPSSAKLTHQIREALAISLIAAASLSGCDNKTEECICRDENKKPQPTKIDNWKPEVIKINELTLCDHLRQLNTGNNAKIYVTIVDPDGTITVTNPCDREEKPAVKCIEPKSKRRQTKKVHQTSTHTPQLPQKTTTNTTKPPVITTVQPTTHDHHPKYTNEAIISFDEQTQTR